MLPNGRNTPMLAVEIAVRARMACIHSVCGAFMPKKGALDESTANIGPVLPFEGDNLTERSRLSGVSRARLLRTPANLRPAASAPTARERIASRMHADRESLLRAASHARLRAARLHVRGAGERLLARACERTDELVRAVRLLQKRHLVGRKLHVKREHRVIHARRLRAAHNG